jgi:hypothetical protein
MYLQELSSASSVGEQCSAETECGSMRIYLLYRHSNRAALAFNERPTRQSAKTIFCFLRYLVL